MAHEIQAPYQTDRTLMASIYYNNSGTITLRETVQLFETSVGSGLYTNTTDIEGLSAGDSVILRDTTETPVVVGGATYKPTVVAEISVDATAVAKTLTIENPQGVPIADATVWVTTDSAGLNSVRTGVTEDHGDVTFYLTPGTYYMFVRKAGYTFTNPTQIEVTDV